MKQLNECGCGCGGAKGGCQDSHEGSMAKHDAMECAEDAQAVANMIQDADNLPEWLESKITLAADYMNRVKDYLTHYMANGADNQVPAPMPGFGGNVTKPQFLPADFAAQLKDAMNEKIQKVEDGWAVYPSKGGKRLGTHPTKKAALKQLAAIEISKHRK
jgi:hypothetical protein